MTQNTVFEETYQNYVAEIRTIDYLSKAELLMVERRDNTLIVPLYNRNFIVSSDGIHAEDDSLVTPAVRVIIAKYILTCREFDLGADDPLMTYRDFKGASPLISYFTTNTNKTLETTFSGKLDSLQKKCRELGAEERKNQLYDCSFVFKALPRVPVILNFNDIDDLFPATCSILYRASAAEFLDMECLAMTGTLLSGKLISD